MSNRKQGTFKVSKIISYIVLVLIVVALLGGLAFFTNGFTDDFKTFYAEVGETHILTSAGGYTLSYDEPLSVDVKYTFGAFSAESTGYSLKVVPNSENGKFDFTIDGKAYDFSAETDLTAGFDIVTEENSFTIAPKGTLLRVLSAVYPDNEVNVDVSAIDFSKDLFTLVITSYNGEANVYINFGIKDFNVTGIVLSSTEIVF